MGQSLNFNIKPIWGEIEKIRLKSSDFFKYNGFSRKASRIT